uniref:Secreted protein n=1 Tax=Steinernema glaseri TaxID=37863 RepID=A0A1I7ZKV0_9BILA
MTGLHSFLVLTADLIFLSWSGASTRKARRKNHSTQTQPKGLLFYSPKPLVARRTSTASEAVATLKTSRISKGATFVHAPIEPLRGHAKRSNFVNH